MYYASNDHNDYDYIQAINEICCREYDLGVDLSQLIQSQAIQVSCATTEEWEVFA